MAYTFVGIDTTLLGLFNWVGCFQNITELNHLTVRMQVFNIYKGLSSSRDFRKDIYLPLNNEKLHFRTAMSQFKVHKIFVTSLQRIFFIKAVEWQQ